ncbi:MAG: hypothetical protein KAT05_02160 [Spirochaetes bacterium]|nr:hypothetical protein [Spirochaetota bacterium]
MGANVRYKFKKGFLLDEEKLRKIHNIITTRITDTEIKYSIERNDSFSFETTNLEKIINEENSKWSKINEINIRLYQRSNLDITLNFSDSGGTLYINGEDRDNVFLLHSELKEYISHEVCTLLPNNILGKYTFPLILAAFIAFIIYTLALSQSTPTINKEMVVSVLNSNDTNAKIDFLIQKEFENTMVNDIPFKFPKEIFLSVLFLLSIGLLDEKNKISQFIYPTNLFLFGKEIEKHNRYLEIRGKIFWIGVVGLIVSIIGGIFVFQLSI